jgi:polyferredoxin
LATGVIILGFIYNKPLTVANFVSLLSGYWPDWHTNLYWFLLLGGLLFVTTAQGKNPYCSWFCPFGAVQEGLAKISGAKLYRPRSLHYPLKWAQRGLAYAAILLGLALRQPGGVSYEPFGTLFDFTGTGPQWVLLVLVLLTSFLIYRPFCTFLCPMDPIVDYIGESRRIVQSGWRKVNARWN